MAGEGQAQPMLTGTRNLPRAEGYFRSATTFKPEGTHGAPSLSERNLGVPHREKCASGRRDRPSSQIETVAVKRRALPMGGRVPEDYVFERIGDHAMPERVKMSELFGPHDTLILYSFMYGPERELPCPGCTHLIDGLEGGARHLGQRASLHIVAKSPIARLAACAHARG